VKNAILGFLFYLLSQAVQAQSGKPAHVPGNWSGEIKLPGRALRIGLEWAGPLIRFHSLDQNMFDIEARQETQAGDTLRLQLPSLRASFLLVPSDSLLTGYYQQGNARFPVHLARQTTPFQKPVRPQEPNFPLPYLSQDVRYQNEAAGVQLAGTFTRPGAAGRYPAVILVPGSGPNERNAHIFGHKVFLVLADYLTRQGFAVLRSDDRGVGESEGTFAEATLSDLASDVGAAARFLKGRADVNPRQIYVLGHSLGAEIGGLAALKYPEIKALVLLAGAAEPLTETIFRQTRTIYAQQGLSEKAISVN